MPKIYGLDKAGRIHREAQPEPASAAAEQPKPRSTRVAPAKWSKVAVVVDGVAYPTGAAADRAMGWRKGATATAVREGRSELGGVSVRRQ